MLILQWETKITLKVLKTLFQALYLEIKALKSTLGENPKITITQKAIHRNL